MDDEVEDDDFDDGEDAEKYDYRRDPDLLNKGDAVHGAALPQGSLTNADPGG
jgi:hypothetical protein